MPNGKLTYKRGDIWWINLKPVIGSETDKERPCLILQNDTGNQYSPATIVAPILPGTRTFPFVVNVKSTQQNGLDKDRYICLSQMRAVDASRIRGKLGELEGEYWEEIEKAVCIELGFSSAFDEKVVHTRVF
ncbi:type II toxin-antitoxin system PemK/MazF family toxin [Gloeocapsopsis dulcis]|uniref:mRNA interferase n=1 Tax=Gloeocapsopsis dulcis AAB1 = 1H9 TaxID=1433147 RepID=A0A6N8G2Q1_9CHRO|nr:type II toxin-antitoxin system PemK/MazF family toxin [Gloeocapsopsis dulcis]MUL39369.1 PemK family transcriptional regulator [Gloeocapsopsis dulcis AAB1 = 1H9]WNN88886.1 type II toxin-antitoxin system PemK/MazF family toxin [Gloeocapsopsis dulcis]